jgi:hypothetical protein
VAQRHVNVIQAAEQPVSVVFAALERIPAPEVFMPAGTRHGAPRPAGRVQPSHCRTCPVKARLDAGRREW